MRIFGILALSVVPCACSLRIFTRTPCLRVQKRGRTRWPLALSAHAAADDFGRGLEHLSADLVEGDVTLFQTGSWAVDGVTVGTGEPRLEAAVLSSIQLVWTHNCEHGVLYGERCSLQEIARGGCSSGSRKGRTCSLGQNSWLRASMSWPTRKAFRLESPRHSDPSGPLDKLGMNES